MRIGGVGVGGVQQRRRRRRGESAISSEIPQFQLREAHGTWPCGPGTMPHNEQPRLPALAVDPDRAGFAATHVAQLPQLAGSAAHASTDSRQVSNHESQLLSVDANASSSIVRNSGVALVAVTNRAAEQ